MKYRFLLAVPLIAAVFTASGCIRFNIGAEVPLETDDYYQETARFESERDYADFLKGLGAQAEPNGEFVEGTATTVWIYEETDIGTGYRAILSEGQFEEYGDDAIELTVTLALYHNSTDDTYDVYATTNWTYPDSWPIVSYNSNVRYYFAITWGGNGNLLATQYEFTSTLENGSEGEWARYKSNAYAGFMWFALDDRSEIESTSAHITIEKPEQVFGRTAGLRLTYLYSYNDYVYPKFSEEEYFDAPEVNVTGSDRYSRLDLHLDGMEY